MSKETLIRRVLDNPRIEIYSCGRRDIRAGIIDRRVLATLEFLAASGMKPTVTTLRCGHGFFTASPATSPHHSTGTAVDIAAINGVPIPGHQGQGSITDRAVRALLTLQGTMKPAPDHHADEVRGHGQHLAMADHDDHIHVGFQPDGGDTVSMLRPEQWDRLVSASGASATRSSRSSRASWSISVTKRARRPPKRAPRAAAKRPRKAAPSRAKRTVAQARRLDAADRPRVG